MGRGITVSAEALQSAFLPAVPDVECIFYCASALKQAAPELLAEARQKPLSPGVPPSRNLQTTAPSGYSARSHEPEAIVLCVGVHLAEVPHSLAAFGRSSRGLLADLRLANTLSSDFQLPKTRPLHLYLGAEYPSPKKVNFPIMVGLYKPKEVKGHLLSY